MNRLRSPAAALKWPASSAIATPQARVEAGVASPLIGEHPSVVFAPMHYEPNYAYPLVVWLHGDGANERQLVKLMPQISLRNYVGVAPRGPAERSLRGKAFGWSLRGAGVAEAEQRVFELIEAVGRRYHVARRRVFLAGADAGGTVALRIALTYPDRFAGALSFGGPFPAGGTPLVRLEEARRLPLFIAYDGGATDFDSARLDEQIRLFYTACMQVMLRSYPPRSHLGRQMLADADRWMMELVTGAADRRPA